MGMLQMFTDMGRCCFEIFMILIKRKGGVGIFMYFHNVGVCEHVPNGTFFIGKMMVNHWIWANCHPMGLNIEEFEAINFCKHI